VSNLTTYLKDVEQFLREERFWNAGHNCGLALESILHNVYYNLLTKATLEQLENIIVVRKKIGGNKEVKSFMLGELIRLYHDAKIFNVIESITGKKLEYTKSMPFNKFNQIRIDCDHSTGNVPTYNEISNFFSNLNLLIEELGDFISKDIHIETVKTSAEDYQSTEREEGNVVDLDPEEKKLIEEDDAAWEIACSINTVESYEEYLSCNTVGYHDGEAKNKIEELKEQAVIDREEWDTAVSENTIRSYKRYLLYKCDKYPKIVKLHKDDAQHKIDIIEDNDCWRKIKKVNTIEAYEKYLARTFKMHEQEAREGINLIRLTEEELKEKQRLEKEEDINSWNTACKKDTIEAYEAYIKGTGKKAYLVQASLRMEELEKEQKRQEEEKRAKDLEQQKLIEEDLSHWKEVCKENTVEAYEAYIKGPGIKAYIVQASSRIELLERETEQNLEEENEKIQLDKTVARGQFLNLLEELIKLRSEEELWKKASNKNTIAAYLEYIKNSSVKKYYSEANQILSALSKENSLKIYEPVKTQGKLLNTEMKTEAPKETINVRGNSISNLVNGGIAAVQGNWIYFRVDDWICKSKLDGTCLQKIVKEKANYINVVGDWIYFAYIHIYKIKTDGSNLTKITKVADSYTDITVLGDWIYFIKKASSNDYGKIYKVRTDGSSLTLLSSEKAISMNVCIDYIYFIKKGMLGATSIWKMKLDGGCETEVLKAKASHIVIHGNHIFYRNDKGIHRFHLNLKKELTIVNGYTAAWGFVIYGAFLYYASGLDLKIVDLDGRYNRTYFRMQQAYKYLSAAGEYMYAGGFRFENEGTCRISLNANRAELYKFDKDSKDIIAQVIYINTDSSKKSQKEQSEGKIVQLKDEKGNAIKFQQLDSIKKDGNIYVILCPADISDDEELEISIFKCLEKANGDTDYLQVSDPTLLQQLFELFQKRMEE
jgi:hypothetical protein